MGGMMEEGRDGKKEGGREGESKFFWVSSSIITLSGVKSFLLAVEQR